MTRLSPSPALPDEDQALRDELAAWLMACDECIGNDAPEDYLDHERSFLRRLRHNVHSGDCTKESHSCVRCQCDTYLANADALLRGPLAILRARATAAEAERDRLSKQLHDSAMDHIARDVGDEQDAGNLIALAKMYGEACRELAKARFERFRTDQRIRMQRFALREANKYTDRGIGSRAYVHLWQYAQKMSRRARAAEAALLEKDGEIARLKAALGPFADLWFSFDGFSAEPAALVFCHREYGQWRCDHHSAFDKMIEAARAALAPTEPFPATEDEASHVSGS